MNIILNRINNNWNKNASVKNWIPIFNENDKLDYPLSLLPIDQSLLLNLTDDKKQILANCLWIQYNKRTIDAEIYIANPAIDLLLNTSCLDKEYLYALHQTAIDERFHTYCHTIAIDNALSRNSVRMNFQESITVNELRNRLLVFTEKWQKDIVQIAFASVAEVSVNAFLETLSNSNEINESNRKLIKIHNMDEKYHSCVFIEIVKELLTKLSKAESDFLKHEIHIARYSFLKHDYSMYESVFSSLNIYPKYNNTSTMLSRDMSGIERLIGVIEQ